MLSLKDFFHVPRLNQLINSLVRDAPGLIVIAGLEPNSLSNDELNTRRMVSGKTTILRLLMREILTFYPQMHCILYAEGENPIRAPRELRSRCEWIQTALPEVRLRRLQNAIQRRPGLMVFDQFTAENIPLVVEAARQGTRVLCPVNTMVRGSAVIRHLQSLGFTPEQLKVLTWVVSVFRQPMLCPACKQPAEPDERLSALYSMDPDPATWKLFRAGGCEQCDFTGRQGELTVFDLFRANPDQPDLLSQRSLLSAQEYLLDLMKQGLLAPEDVLDFDKALLHDTYAILEVEEKALKEANAALQRKVLELEVSNRLLVQRTEAIISFQEIARTLIQSINLTELAQRVCRYSRDICGADRSIVYVKLDEENLVVLACGGWDGVGLSREVPARSFSGWQQAEEMRPWRTIPPGIILEESEPPAIRVGYDVPLLADGRLVGRMIVQSTKKVMFTPGEISTLRMFANQVAVAMQRARLIEELQAKITELEAAQVSLVQKERMEHELELARQVQQSILPRQFPSIPGVEFAVLNQPARQVGGDFYDVIPLDENHFGVVVADVSDKGLPAAFYMALARSLILAEAHRELSPRRVLKNVNRLLLELGEGGMFVTVFYGVVDCAAWKITYARAGHDLPVLLHRGEMSFLSGGGMALGVTDGDEFHLTEVEVPLKAGDRLILYTDGLVDVQSPEGERFNLERLTHFWRGLPVSYAGEVCQATLKILEDFQGGAEQSDDMTLLVVCFHGQDNSPRLDTNL